MLGHVAFKKELLVICFTSVLPSNDVYISVNVSKYFDCTMYVYTLDKVEIQFQKINRLAMLA